MDWLSTAETFDFFDAKGILETFMDILNIEVTFEPVDQYMFVAGRSAELLLNGKAIGVIGEVDSKVLDSFEIELSPVTLFELDLDMLLEIMPDREMKYIPLSRYPGAFQDLSVVLDSDISANGISYSNGSLRIGKYSLADLDGHNNYFNGIIDNIYGFL